MDEGAADDATDKRHSTFHNAHLRLRLFTGRDDPDEKLYIVLINANRFQPRFDVYPVGEEREPIPMEQVLDELVELVSERDPDFYEADNGSLKKV